MNTSKKGASKELHARKILAEEGWTIVFQSVRTRWATYDFADLFDIVAVAGMTHIYVSCKHLGNGNHYRSHQKDIESYRMLHGHADDLYQLWLWRSARWIGGKDNKKWIGAGFIRITV